MPIEQRQPGVAYFCMEYGLNEEFPIYAGGLGILAGDYLKSAGEMQLPAVGLGILWQQGYTTQLINEDGRPYDVYQDQNFDFLKDTGVTVSVPVQGQQVLCRVWLVDKYGNAPLYLLDTALPANEGRSFTYRLYGGSGEDRIAQEIILGIGGIRALRALGIEVDVYHFNEGHAVFAGIELIREKMQFGLSFEQAWQAVRRQIVFTTHTPVPAGNESHQHHDLQRIGAYNGLTYEQMLCLGGDPFNMTAAGLRLARISNAVSHLHRETARKMWQDTPDRAPIIGITNGVHPGTWQDSRLRTAFLKDEDLWQPHMEAKKDLIAEVFNRTGCQLNSDSLLIGFARRAASYKRGELIFRRPEVINPLLESGKVQLIFAGKAHPQDEVGKEIISNLVAQARRHPGQVVFLENYDMAIGRLLTSGCDVWLNNPRRPQEASGTSGMKAAMNGVLNMSILDGWWPEGCSHGVNGWQIGGNCNAAGDGDEDDVNTLYQVLLSEVVPLYYSNQARWTRMMHASINMSHHRFSSARMLQEYFGRMYEAKDAMAGRKDLVSNAG